MRDKKVRAWDKVIEEYLYSDKFPSMWQFYKELENRGIRHWETEDSTGLHDKNGIEIYQGDIVEKWLHGRYLEPRDSVIKNSSGYFKSLTTIVKWSEQGLNYNIYPHHDDAYWLVVGNIWEHS